MNTYSSRKQSVRGSAAPKVIAGVVVLAAVAAGAWWFLQQREAKPAVVATTTSSGTSASAAADAAAPVVEGLSIDQLYREARKAMDEQRLVSPAGNNALEYYLAILQQDAKNSGAADAVRELFPFASGTAEQEINQGDLEDAGRIIASLAKADPSNYTLTILRSKLEAKRKQIADAEAAAQAAALAAATPTVQPANTGTGAAETATPTTTAPAETIAPAPADTVAEATPPPASVQPAATPAPVGESRDVQVVTPVPPDYPAAAARKRTEGWVEVEFTVTADGTVENATVVASEPARIFDRSAIAAIQKTKFSPRLVNGVPVDSTLRRRIEFKFGG